MFFALSIQHFCGQAIKHSHTLERRKHNQEWYARASCEAEKPGQHVSHQRPCQVWGSGAENIAMNTCCSSATTGTAQASRLIRNCIENVPGHHYWQRSRDGDITALTMLTSAAMKDVTTQQPSEITQSLCSATESIFLFVFLCVCHLGSFLTVILITQSLPALLAHQYSGGAEQEWEVTGRIHLSQFWKLTEPAVLFAGMSDSLSPSPKNSAEMNSVENPWQGSCFPFLCKLQSNSQMIQIEIWTGMFLSE